MLVSSCQEFIFVLLSTYPLESLQAAPCLTSSQQNLKIDGDDFKKVGSIFRRTNYIELLLMPRLKLSVSRRPD